MLCPGTGHPSKECHRFHTLGTGPDTQSVKADRDSFSFLALNPFCRKLSLSYCMKACTHMCTQELIHVYTDFPVHMSSQCTHTHMYNTLKQGRWQGWWWLNQKTAALDKPRNPVCRRHVHSISHIGALASRSEWAPGRTPSAPPAYPGRQGVSCLDSGLRVDLSSWAWWAPPCRESPGLPVVPWCLHLRSLWGTWNGGEQVTVAQPSEGLWSLHSEDQFVVVTGAPRRKQGIRCPGGLLDTTGYSGRDSHPCPWVGRGDSALGRVTGACRTG